jgi:hypothetical protein
VGGSNRVLGDLTQVLADLEWLRALLITGITGGGGYGIFRLWKLFSSDFLTPYRDEMGDLRARVDQLEQADEKKSLALNETRKSIRACEEREHRLRMVLIRNGIEYPEQDATPPKEPPL